MGTLLLQIPDRVVLEAAVQVSSLLVRLLAVYQLLGHPIRSLVPAVLANLPVAFIIKYFEFVLRGHCILKARVVGRGLIHYRLDIG